MKQAALDLGPSPPASIVTATPGTQSRWFLVATTLMIAATTVRALRLEIGGLFVPLHVIPILLATPIIVLPSLKRFPREVGQALVAFLLLFSVAVLRYGERFGDLIKMATSVLTIVAVALMVRSRRDFSLATLGLCVSLLIANANGFRGGYTEYIGYRPLGDIANKNAYSLYALPIALLAGFSLVHFSNGKVARLLLTGAIISSAFILFTGANRSGWGGIVLIGALLAVQTRKWRALAVIGAVALMSYAAFAWWGTSTTFNHRVEQTTEGYSSDELRMNMFSTAVEIGVENPVLGLTPQGLGKELARRLGGDLPELDTHNFLAYIIGGCGFLTLLALIVLAVVLWRRPPISTPQIIASHDLIRMILIVFVLRGVFSREVFFVGPFPIALGLALGLVRVCMEEASSTVRRPMPHAEIGPAAAR